MLGVLFSGSLPNSLWSSAWNCNTTECYIARVKLVFMKPFFCAVGVAPYNLLYFVCRLAAWAAHCLFINPGESSTYATWTPKLDIGRCLLPAGRKELYENGIRVGSSHLIWKRSVGPVLWNRKTFSVSQVWKHLCRIWRCMHRASSCNMYINQQDAQNSDELTLFSIRCSTCFGLY